MRFQWNPLLQLPCQLQKKRNLLIMITSTLCFLMLKTLHQLKQDNDHFIQNRKKVTHTKSSCTQKIIWTEKHKETIYILPIQNNTLAVTQPISQARHCIRYLMNSKHTAHSTIQISRRKSHSPLPYNGHRLYATLIKYKKS